MILVIPDGHTGPWRFRPSFDETNPDLRKDIKLIWFATGKEAFLIETTRATVAMLRKYNFDIV